MSGFDRYRHFIVGAWVDGAYALPDVNPSDLGDVLGEAIQGGPAEVEQAVAAARSAFPS